MSGWWFGTFFVFPYIGDIHPNWLHNIFQKGWNHQPDVVRWMFHEINHPWQLVERAGGSLGRGIGCRTTRPGDSGCFFLRKGSSNGATPILVNQRKMVIYWDLYRYRYLIAGDWNMTFLFSQMNWESHPPNCRTHIFQRSWNHQAAIYR